MNNVLKRCTDKNLLRRTVLMLAGVLIMGVAVALARLADFGTDPCTTMNLGVSGVLRAAGLEWMTFGTYQMIFNVILLIAVFAFDRRKIGAATFVNMICVGYLSDLFVWLYSLVVPTDTPLWLRIVFLVIFVPLGSFACSMYMASDLGTAPYDSIAPMLRNAAGKKLSFRAARLICDIAAVAVGFICGATVGVGTLLMAVTSGPLMQLFGKTIVARFYRNPDERRSDFAEV